MQKKSIIIALYACLVLIGGIMGYLMAHSLISLIAGTSTSCLLLICSYLIWQGNHSAYSISLGLVSCLLTFFSYRFLMSFKFMPNGLMTLFSTLVFVYLMYSPKIAKEIKN